MNATKLKNRVIQGESNEKGLVKSSSNPTQFLEERLPRTAHTHGSNVSYGLSAMDSETSSLLNIKLWSVLTIFLTDKSLGPLTITPVSYSLLKL